MTTTAAPNEMRKDSASVVRATRRSRTLVVKDMTYGQVNVAILHCRVEGTLILQNHHRPNGARPTQHRVVTIDSRPKRECQHAIRDRILKARSRNSLALNNFLRFAVEIMACSSLLLALPFSPFCWPCDLLNHTDSYSLPSKSLGQPISIRRTHTADLYQRRNGSGRIESWQPS